MPIEDRYGQGVAIPALTDAPNIEASVKDTINALVERSVMRFQSANERNATIVAPVDGTMAWLETEQLLTQYAGGQWAVVAAGSQAWSQVPLTSDWAHNGNLNGTFQYRKVNFFGQPTIMLDGGIERVTAYPSEIPGGYFTLNTAALPTEVRPSTRKTLTVTCSDTTSSRIALKLDIRMDGWMRLYGFTQSVTPPWVSFNGVFCSL